MTFSAKNLLGGDQITNLHDERIGSQPLCLWEIINVSTVVSSFVAAELNN